MNDIIKPVWMRYKAGMKNQEKLEEKIHNLIKDNFKYKQEQ